MRKLFWALLGLLFLLLSCREDLPQVPVEHPKENPQEVSIQLHPHQIHLAIDEEADLTAECKPSEVELIWSSDDNSIVQIDQKGHIRALAKGETRIMAQPKDSNVKFTCSGVRVYVTDPGDEQKEEYILPYMDIEKVTQEEIKSFEIDRGHQLIEETKIALNFKTRSKFFPEILYTFSEGRVKMVRMYSTAEYLTSEAFKNFMKEKGFTAKENSEVIQYTCSLPIIIVVRIKASSGLPTGLYMIPKVQEDPISPDVPLDTYPDGSQISECDFVFPYMKMGYNIPMKNVEEYETQIGGKLIEQDQAANDTGTMLRCLYQEKSKVFAGHYYFYGAKKRNFIKVQVKVLNPAYLVSKPFRDLMEQEGFVLQKDREELDEHFLDLDGNELWINKKKGVQAWVHVVLKKQVDYPYIWIEEWEDPDE